MGCCVSTLDDNKTLKKDQHFSCVSKSPPILEEESVKEVLSETPKPKPKHKPGSETGTKASNNVEQPTKSRPFLEQKLPSLIQKLPHYEQKLTSMEQKLIPMKQNKYYPDPTTTPEAEEEQISEVCSLSESISTTTLEDHHMQLPNYTTTAGDFPQRVMYRSQGQNSHFLPKNNYLNNQGRSPARRADPSPPRRNSPGRVGPKRDAVGENSARRSRSPATRSNVGRSPSARRAGPSPGRVRMVNGPGEVRRERDANVDEWAGPEESLENPLVSLECFIFL